MMNKQTINIYIYAPDKSMIGKMEEHYVPFNKGEHISVSGVSYEVLSINHLLNLDYRGLFVHREVIVIAKPLQNYVQGNSL